MQKMQETRVQSVGWKDPLEEGMQPTPVFLPGESHGQRCLAGYSLWGHTESWQIQLSSTQHNVADKMRSTISTIRLNFGGRLQDQKCILWEEKTLVWSVYGREFYRGELALFFFKVGNSLSWIPLSFYLLQYEIYGVAKWQWCFLYNSVPK